MTENGDKCAHLTTWKASGGGTPPPKSRKQRLAPLSADSPGYRVRPASQSMFKSSLNHQTYKPPEVKALDEVRAALERDSYRTGSTRFKVQFPRSPQHEKYCWIRSPLGAYAVEDEELGDNYIAPSATSPRPECTVTGASLKYNMESLARWFKEIDKDGSGIVSTRELIVALRKQKGMREQLFKIVAPPADGVIEKIDGVSEKENEDVFRVRDIMKKMDTDGGGTMEWDEFVDFFRRCGMLLEYKTKSKCGSAKNRTTLCNNLEISRELLSKMSGGGSATVTPDCTLPSLSPFDGTASPDSGMGMSRPATSDQAMSPPLPRTAWEEIVPVA